MEWKNKKVIVTGGAGVIGRDLVKKLADKGAIVRCFDIAPKPQVFSDNIKYYQGDLSQLNPIEFEDFNPQIIFHLAASFERTKEETDFWEPNFSNNVLLSHKVVDVAKSCKGLEKFIFASSYLIYDPTIYLFKDPNSNPIVLRENYAVSPRNLCGAAKYYTERELGYLRSFKETYSFKTISARIFRVYGQGSKDVISRWIRTGLNNETIKLFLKQGSFDYIFADDVSSGLLKLAESDLAEGVVNLGSGVSTKIGKVVEILKKYLPGLKVEEVEKQGLFEASSADISRLKQITNWQPEVNLEQGIKSILEYEAKQKN